MQFDQSTVTAMVSFFMKVTAAVSVICVSKLYKMVTSMEEDKNHNYYVTYYKISELENYIEALQHDVTHMKEMCVQFEDKLAMQKVLIQHAYHVLPQEEDVINDFVTTSVTNELEVSNDVSNEVTNEETNKAIGTLISIKEEIINPDYVEEKNKINVDQEYEHIVKSAPVEPAPKYKLWKGLY
jgi:hypothetical protein